MRVLPVLFNTEMVQALLDGRKTVTRRVVKLECENTHLEMRTDKYGTRLIEIQNEEPGVTTIKNTDGTTTHRLLAAIEKEPPYRPGDILYVRETWREDVGRYMYKADYSDGEKFYRNGDEVQISWRPSSHMPREAARIFLRVTDVRVERLQDIDGPGIKAEGVVGKNFPAATRGAFIDVWDSTIKPADLPLYGWAANPWVWVIEFERISREEVPEWGG